MNARFVFTCVALIAILVIAATPAQAKERRYRTQSDETASGLAKHFYGAAWKSVYILTKNGFKDDALPSGKRITLPSSWIYYARRGDSFASIAKRYMGKAERYSAMLRFNRLSERRGLEVGQEILLPFHLRHTVTSGESLSQLSRTYYRTNKLSGMLKEYNGLKDWKLNIGQRLTIPIFDRSTVNVDKQPLPGAGFAQNNTDSSTEDSAESDPDGDDTGSEEPSAVTALIDEVGEGAQDLVAAFEDSEPSDSESTDADAPEAKEESRYDDEPNLRLPTVDAAINAYRKGFFRTACERLEEMLDGPKLSPDQRGRVIRYLGFCSVAFDDESAARDYFRSWLLTTPDATLDRRLTSPKILVIFDEAVREVRGTN